MVKFPVPHFSLFAQFSWPATPCAVTFLQLGPLLAQLLQSQRAAGCSAPRWHLAQTLLDAMRAPHFPRWHRRCAVSLTCSSFPSCMTSHRVTAVSPAHNEGGAPASGLCAARPTTDGMDVAELKDALHKPCTYMYIYIYVIFVHIDIYLSISLSMCVCV